MKSIAVSPPPVVLDEAFPLAALHECWDRAWAHMSLARRFVETFAPSAGAAAELRTVYLVLLTACEQMLDLTLPPHLFALVLEEMGAAEEARHAHGLHARTPSELCDACNDVTLGTPSRQEVA